MARQIIILETAPAEGGQINVRCIFWFPIAVGQEEPMPGFVTAFKTKGAIGPTSQEVTDLQDGKVVEEVKSFSFPTSATAAQVQSQLAASYTSRLNYRTTLPLKGKYYGVSFDGTTWTPVP